MLGRTTAQVISRWTACTDAVTLLILHFRIKFEEAAAIQSSQLFPQALFSRIIYSLHRGSEQILLLSIKITFLPKHQNRNK